MAFPMPQLLDATGGIPHPHKFLPLHNHGLFTEISILARKCTCAQSVLSHLFLKVATFKTSCGQTQWLIPVIPALWEAGWADCLSQGI